MKPRTSKMLLILSGLVTTPALMLGACDRSPQTPPAPAKAPDTKGTAAPAKPDPGIQAKPEVKADDKSAEPAAPATPPAPPYTGPNKPIEESAKPYLRTTTPSGLTLEDYTKGDGVPVIPKSVVTFKSIGRLKLGDKPFENNYEGDKPVTANLDELMPGLRDGMMGMRVGGQRRIYVPAQQAFGFVGRKDMTNPTVFVVPPDTDVVFDIELMNVKFKFVAPEAPKPFEPTPVTKEEPRS